MRCPPRIQLTAVPYAFQAGTLSATSGANVGTLSFGSITGTDAITLPDASGTVCLQNATACGFAPSTGGTGYINLQASTPGSAQTGNFNISGTGILSTLQSASGASGTTLTVQAGAATSGTNVGGTLLLQGGAGASTGASGSVIVKANTNDSTTAFQVQNAAGSALLTADTVNSKVTVGGIQLFRATQSCNYANYTSAMAGMSPSGYWKLEDTSGTTAVDSSGNGDTGTISATGVALNNTPGPFSCATSHPYMTFSAASSGTVTSANTLSSPSSFSLVAMFNTTSNGPLISSTGDRGLYIGTDGLLRAATWNGTNFYVTSPGTVNDGNWHEAVMTFNSTTGHTELYLDGSLIATGNGGVNSATVKWQLGFMSGVWSSLGGGGYYSGSLAQVAAVPSVLSSYQVYTLAADAGLQSSSFGFIGVDTSSPAYPIDVVGDINTSSQYRVNGTVVCTLIGCTPAAGSNNYLQLQGSTPGSAQTGNFNISGTGIAATLQASSSVKTPTLDSISGTLTIGNGSATAINIGKTSGNIATTITGTTVVKPSSGNDSTTEFQIQNAAGLALLTTDTVNSKLTVGNVQVLQSSQACNYSSYTTAVQALTPRAYWELEDTSGTTAVDSSGNSDTGTISATGVTLNQTPGPFACATSHPYMTFNAANSGNITSATSYSSPASFSLIAIFKSTSVGPLISSNGDRGLYIGSDGKLYAATWNGGANFYAISSGTVNDGNWHEAVMTFTTASGGQQQLYLDGRLQATTSAGVNSASAQWQIGHMTGSWNNLSSAFYTGSLAHVAVIHSVLTNYQVANLLQYSGLQTYFIGVNITPSLYTLDVGGDINTSTQYRIGGTVICTSSGCTPAAGSNNYIQLQASTPGTAQTGNFNISGTGILSTLQSASGASGTTLTVQGGAATSGTNTGGTLLLQGGAGASTGASGSVIVKANTNDSTTAFQVQNAAGTTTLLNADTSNLKVTVAGSIVNTFSSSPGLVQLSSTTTFATNPAWVTVQGKFAYVIEAGGTQSLEILDITKPSAPVRLGTLSLNAASPAQIQVVGRYAYIAEQGASNAGVLEVVDLSNKQSPTSVATLSTGSSPGPFGVTVVGNYAYIADSNTNDMAIVNISNPAAPRLVSTVATNTSPRKIAVQGKYAYVISCGGVTPKIQSIDISNPAAPSLVSSASLGQCAANISIEGRYAYVTGITSDGELDVFDISNPTSIPAAVYFSAATHAYAWGNALAGRYLFTSSTTAASPGSIGVVDISTPTAPSLLQTYTDGGAFGNPRALFLSGRYLFMTDKTNNKLFIFDTSGLETTAATIHSLEAGTLTVDTDASVANNLTVGNWLGVGQGGITTSGNLAVGGTTTFANTTNSTSAFKIQDASGNAVLVTDTTNDEVGIDTSVAWNRFVVAPTVYSTGTLTRTNGSTTLVGTGTVWTNSMVGDKVIFVDGTTAIITAFTDGTHVTMDNPYGGTTDASPITYEFHNPGLEVTGGGLVGAGTVAPTNTLTAVGGPLDTTLSGLTSYALAVGSTLTNPNDLTLGSDGSYAYLQSWYSKPLKINNLGNNILLNPAGTGSVGIGNAGPSYKLDVSGDINTSGAYRASGTAGISVTCSGTQALNGITVSGGIITAGSCATNAADLAEQYGSTQSLAPGEIVAIASGDYRSVERSISAGQSNLLGIVSTNPYQVMGNDQPGYPIALAGRVPTKVDLEGGVIHKGDKITSSSTPGVGMKANGAGMVVGTALEDYSATGVGEIEVFVGLSYYDPLSTLQGTDSFTDLNVSGTATVQDLTVTGTATFKGNIIVSGHIITSGNAPSAAVLPAAGTDLFGASSGTCTVAGDDTSGVISITTGAANVNSGAQCTLTFAQAFDAVPHPVLTATGALGATLGVYVSATTTTLTVNFAQPPAPGTTYAYNFVTIQ